MRKSPLLSTAAGFSLALAIGLGLVMTAGSALHAESEDKSAATEERYREDSPGRLQLDYLQYLPEGYAKAPDQRWPLVVFLHGAGERGDNLDAVKVHGPPKLAEGGRKFPFILIAPQCPADSWWTWQPVMPLIEHLEKTLRIDADRICVTGLSMGGYGTWHLATRYPEKFAAVAPVCGGGVPYLTRRIPRLPVWAFHGARDTVVPLIDSERMIDALKRAGNPHAKLTVYPKAGHDSWTETYANDALYQWLMSHRRGEPATADGTGDPKAEPEAQSKKAAQ